MMEHNWQWHGIHIGIEKLIMFYEYIQYVSVKFQEMWNCHVCYWHLIKATLFKSDPYSGLGAKFMCSGIEP